MEDSTAVVFPLPLFCGAPASACTGCAVLLPPAHRWYPAFRPGLGHPQEAVGAWGEEVDPGKSTASPLMPRVSCCYESGPGEGTRWPWRARGAAPGWSSASARGSRTPAARQGPAVRDRVSSVCSQRKKILYHQRMFLHLLSSFSPPTAMTALLLLSLHLRTGQDLVKGRQRHSGLLQELTAVCRPQRGESSPSSQMRHL